VTCKCYKRIHAAVVFINVGVNALFKILNDWNICKTFFAFLLLISTNLAILDGRQTLSADFITKSFSPNLTVKIGDGQCHNRTPEEVFGAEIESQILMQILDENCDVGKIILLDNNDSKVRLTIISNETVLVMLTIKSGNKINLANDQTYVINLGKEDRFIETELLCRPFFGVISNIKVDYICSLPKEHDALTFLERITNNTKTDFIIRSKEKDVTVYQSFFDTSDLRQALTLIK